MQTRDVGAVDADHVGFDDEVVARALGAEARRRVLAEYTDAAIAERTLAFWRSVTAGASP